MRMGRRNLCFFFIRISVVLDKASLNIYHVRLASILGFIPVRHQINQDESKENIQLGSIPKNITVDCGKRVVFWKNPKSKYFTVFVRTRNPNNSRYLSTQSYGLSQAFVYHGLSVPVLVTILRTLNRDTEFPVILPITLSSPVILPITLR